MPCRCAWNDAATGGLVASRAVVDADHVPDCPVETYGGFVSVAAAVNDRKEAFAKLAAPVVALFADHGVRQYIVEVDFIRIHLWRGCARGLRQDAIVGDVFAGKG